MQEHLYRHFSSPGHRGFLNDVSVTLIDKTDGPDPKKREDYWMKTLKTMAPWNHEAIPPNWKTIYGITEVRIYLFMVNRCKYYQNLTSKALLEMTKEIFLFS